MINRKIIGPAIVLVLLLIVSASGDFLVVSRSANIKSAPQGDAEVLLKAEVDDSLTLLDDGAQENGYYKVLVPGQTQEGWIYRTLVRRYPGELASGTTISATAYNVAAQFCTDLTPQQKAYAERHLSLGKPQAIYERVREGYALAEDGRLKIPVWVQYTLQPSELNGPADRDDPGINFAIDTSIPAGSRSELADYHLSGFDRGHMAPAEDMTRNDKVMSECFLLSNMAPQIGAGFNNGIWKSLETAVRGWVQQRGELTIIAGPVFAVENDTVKYGIIGENHVAVPTQFYKIIVDANDPQNIQALAFLIPHRRFVQGQYAEFLCSIDDIEKATGLDFLSALPQNVQASLESVKADAVW